MEPNLEELEKITEIKDEAKTLYDLSDSDLILMTQILEVLNPMFGYNGDIILRCLKGLTFCLERTKEIRIGTSHDR